MSVESAAYGPNFASGFQGTSGGPDATPAARELAEEADLDLSTVDGTGADGRIIKADVQSAIDDEE